MTAKPPISPNPSTVQIAALAEQLRDVVGRFVRSVRSHSGTTTDTQNETLTLLERTGPLSIAALAEHRGVKHQSMRLVTARLSEAGLIEMLPDHADRRGYLVSLTAAGRARNESARQARASWIADALASTLTPHELATLESAIPLLRRIAEAQAQR